MRAAPPAASALGARFLLDPSDARSLVAQARAEWPREACGLIVSQGPLGAAPAPRIIFPSTNVIDELHREHPERFPPPTEGYVMDPRILRTAQHWLRRGWRLGAIYHSHSNGVAGLSAGDRTRALGPDARPFFPEAIYLVIGLARRHEVPTLTAWAWGRGGFMERKVSLSASQLAS